MVDLVRQTAHQPAAQPEIFVGLRLMFWRFAIRTVTEWKRSINVVQHRHLPQGPTPPVISGTIADSERTHLDPPPVTAADLSQQWSKIHPAFRGEENDGFSAHEGSRALRGRMSRLSSLVRRRRKEMISRSR